MLCHAVAQHVDLAVTFAAEAQELIILGDDLPGGPREVDREGADLTAEVIDLEDEIVGQRRLVPPDHPAAAERGQTVLMAGAVDRLHARKPEVPRDLRRAEGREEPAARGVDMNVDVEPRPLLKRRGRPAGGPGS